MNRIQKILSQIIQSQHASLAVTLILGSLAVYQVAVTTWLLVPADLPQTKWQPSITVQTTSSVNRGVSLDVLSRLHLFGEVKKTGSEPKRRQKVLETTRKTALKLTLTGLVASSDPTKALAIIEHRGKQETYGYEDTISGTQAIIEDVMHDRVVLNNRGVLENLFLDTSSKTSSSGSERTQSTRSRPAKTTQQPDVKSLIENPGDLTDYIKISPVKKSGDVVGYRLRPGKDPTLFKSAGLENNDIAVAINGFDLTDIDQAMDVMDELPSLESASLTVERDGQLFELYIELPTPE